MIDNTVNFSSEKVVEASPVLLVDASIYIFQYYFSMPDHWFSEKEQWPTAAVYGYTAFLLRLLRNQQPKRIAACFDESLGNCFRNEICPDYKSSRVLPDDALAFQLHACKQVTELLGIKVFASPRYEADDLLGSLYARCRRSALPIALLSKDKDLAQLLSRPQDFLWDYSSSQRFYEADVYTKFGVRPDQLVDYLALVGDSVDDILGVPGIGAKTAVKLLSYYDSIASLLRNVSTVEQLPSDYAVRGAKRIIQNLLDYQEQIAISQQLAKIVTDLPIINSVNEINISLPDTQGFARFCVSMGFPQLSSTLSRSLSSL